MFCTGTTILLKACGRVPLIKSGAERCHLEGANVVHAAIYNILGRGPRSDNLPVYLSQMAIWNASTGLVSKGTHDRSRRSFCRGERCFPPDARGWPRLDQYNLSESAQDPEADLH